MVQFSKLRLTGFKSFVDSAELLIEPGLTGIVGPNGCGKSNLLEALRWCMGEGSAKQLRGGGMDDVIFAGSRDRPPRNIAEVAIHLDNRGRRARAGFNDAEELEVIRRIERDRGSHYRVNGKEQRARDVQLLFADLSTGARSSAVVRQGRIGEVINAKPIDRRLLLEEAAGITGLHSRRHEAELRLRAAETNLERLDDVITALAGQLQGLKRQARQASRYRNLSDHIRRAEAIQLHLRWTAAVAEQEMARVRLEEIERTVAGYTRKAAKESTALAEAADTLPSLRQAEAEAAVELHRTIAERESLEAEQARLEARRQDLEGRLAQIDADVSRETAFQADARAALDRLDGEAEDLGRARDGHAEAEQAAVRRVDAAAREVDDLDKTVTALTEAVAADAARRADLERRIADHEERRHRLAQTADQIAEERAAAEAESADAGAADRAEEALAGATEAMSRARAAAEAAEEDRAAAASAEADTRRTLQAAEENLNRLRAERSGLLAVIAESGSHDFPPIVGRIEVEAGYEPALGAALGDDLTAALDEEAPVHWGAPLSGGEGPPLPRGAEPLSSFVKAPALLALRLSQIGVVDDEGAARALADRLAQGQRLVTRTGAMWRWDGLRIAAGAPTATATLLKHRNRLSELEREIADAETGAADAAGRFAAAREEAENAMQAERRTTAALRETFDALDAVRAEHGQVAKRLAAHAARLDSLAEAAKRVAQEKRETESGLDEARAALAGLAPPDKERQRLVDLRSELESKREELAERRQTRDRLAAEAEARRARLAGLDEERDSWTERARNSTAQMAQLAERRRATEAELEELAELPDRFRRRQSALMDATEAAESKRTAAADRLAEAEAETASIEARVKAAERDLADARESRGRTEGTVSQARQALSAIVERIRERLGCGPEDALPLAELKEGEPLPHPEDVERKLDRLLRERETMGPVNLRAEQEARELNEQITTYETEREDLVAAIDKFRRAIADLNREGRERLLASFETVDTHFRELFVRLYGGGRAQLKLADSDDPLDAGLEVMASPPGKRLQSLSLLSGGEKALTALALLFAVFLTNPAPICVLDEVDAPLDDANVDRFCSLVQDIAYSTDTRFLIVTHHRMTMARTDRLYGVTMPESGVSQLVSVDLREAESMRETA